MLGLAGLPALNDLPILVTLACPLMMMFMMGGINHGCRTTDAYDHSHAGHRSEEP